jgi:hypothetical protein
MTKQASDAALEAGAKWVSRMRDNPELFRPPADVSQPEPKFWIERFLERVPSDKDRWREALELMVRQQPQVFKAPPGIDPLVWQQPPGYDMSMRADPRNPYQPPDYRATYISLSEYYEIHAYTLTADPVLERVDPLMIRMQFDDIQPPPYGPGVSWRGGESVGWRLVAIWCGHLRAGDRLTPGGYGVGSWQPGFYYPPMPTQGMPCWMSRYA